MCNQGNAEYNIPAKKDAGDSLRSAETLPWVHTPAGVFFERGRCVSRPKPC